MGVEESDVGVPGPKTANFRKVLAPGSGDTGLTKLIHTVEPIPPATAKGAKICPIPTSKALDKTPGRFRPADFEFFGPRARSWAKNAKNAKKSVFEKKTKRNDRVTIEIIVRFFIKLEI